MNSSMVCDEVIVVFEQPFKCASHMADEFGTDHGVKASQFPLRGFRAEKVLQTDRAGFSIRSFSLST
jgi:hypothetical protein